MKIGIKYGLDCGHFTKDDRILNVDVYDELYGVASFIGEREYCDTCFDMKRVKRIQIFLIGEFPIREFP